MVNVLAIEHSDSKHADIVLVDWMLGNSCNFACSYCPTGLHDGSVKWQNYEIISEFLEKINVHYQEQMERQIWIQFTGGEPSMHPKFFDIFAKTQSLGIKTSLISNGSRTERFWKKAVGLIDSAILTYHSEQVNDREFQKTCEILSSEIPVHINITANPNTFNHLYKKAQQLAANFPNASLTLKPLRVGFGSELYPYSSEQMEILAQHISTTKRDATEMPRGEMVQVDSDGRRASKRPNEFILENTNRWQGFRCNAGLESLRINADGRVTRAVCTAGGLLGRLGHEISLPLVSVKCPKQTCSCVSDILITKRSSHD